MMKMLARGTLHSKGNTEMRFKLPSFTSSSGLCCVYLGYKVTGLVQYVEIAVIRIMSKYRISLQFLQ